MAYIPSKLQQQLAAGSLLLTGNKRLARAVSEAYSQSQIDSGKQSWDTPSVMPFNAWLHQQWDGSLAGTLIGYDGVYAGRRLLSTQEEQYVWRQVIESSAESDRLINVAGLAGHAAQALASMQAACLGFSDWNSRVNEDALAFKKWAAEFQQRCDQQGWVTQGQLASAVTEMVVSGKLSVPPNLLLSGFDEFTKQQQTLLNALAENGADIAVLDAIPSEQGAQVRCVQADSIEEEIQLAAEWARQHLLAAQSQGKPLPNLGVVVLDMARQRRRCQVAFEKTLHPRQFDIVSLNTEQPTLAFNMSVGPALSEWPLITAALDGLSLLDQGLTPAEFGRWLRSLWRVGEPADLTEVEQLTSVIDVYARKDGRDHWYLSSVLSLLEKERLVTATGGGFPLLVETLNAANACRDASPRLQLQSVWCQHVAELLRLLKWPGPLPPTALEFQLIRAWNDGIDELSGFDAISGEISFRKFLQLLRSRAAQNPFQPRSTPAPVQVMGLLEASGAQFDAMWMIGMTSAAWPAQPRPNPLLPSHWQRENKLPHASVERETEYARLVTQRLSSAAPDVTFSWGKHAGEEELSFSPLLRHLPMEQHGAAVQALHANPTLDTVSENQWIPLEGYREGEIAQSGGGTSVIQNQSACGFRAFATHRLAARPLEEPVFGLDRRDRGTLVHEVMQLLWNRLKTQATLQTKSDDELEQLVTEVVEEVTGQHSSSLSQLKQQLATIERQVLQRLILEWLEQDKLRGAFSTVATEVEDQAVVGPLRLNVTADRIDTLPTGEKVVIDYKTSRNLNYAAWMRERPEEPQMPIYAVSLSDKQQQLAGVLYANLIPGGCKYQGVTEDDDLAPAVKAKGWGGHRALSDADSLDELVQEWREELERLATDYAKGVALIDPKTADSCTYCGLQSLCRINQQPEEDE